jgi:hypothetical protein
MKNFVFTLIVAAGLLAAGTSQSANILPSPGFETWWDSLGGSMPVGWGTTDPFAPGTATKSTYAHSGSYSLRLAFIDSFPGEAVTGAWVVGGTHYDFSLWHRIPTISGMGIYGLVQYNSADSAVNINMNFLTYSPTWTQTTVPFNAHPEAVFTVVMLTCMADTVYLDDVVLDGQQGPGIEEQIPARMAVDARPLCISPNPCKGTAKITALLDGSVPSGVKIYDACGRLVRSLEVHGTGLVAVEWDTRDSNANPVPSGTYFLRLDSGSSVLSERITVIR